MDINELEKRITVLEDIEAIKKLKARYCAICDDNHNPAKITDAVRARRDLGRRRRRAASGARGDPQAVPGIPGTDQLLAAQRHESDHRREGDRATGIWYFIGPFTMRSGNRAMWLGARYEEDYVKLDGEWKFRTCARSAGCRRRTKKAGRSSRHFELNSSSLELTTFFTASTARPESCRAPLRSAPPRAPLRLPAATRAAFRC